MMMMCLFVELVVGLIFIYNIYFTIICRPVPDDNKEEEEDEVKETDLADVEELENLLEQKNKDELAAMKK